MGRVFGISRQAGVAQVPEGAERGEHQVALAGEQNFLVFELDAALLKLGAIVQGGCEEGGNGLQIFLDGDADMVRGDDAGGGDGGIGEAVAAEGVFDDRLLLEDGGLRGDERLLVGGDLGFGADDFNGASTRPRRPVFDCRSTGAEKRARALRLTSTSSLALTSSQ